MAKENVKKLLPRVIQRRLEFDNTFHPGVDPKDLIHTVHGIVVSDHPEDILDSYDRYHPYSQLLCSNCGLTESNATAGYTSRVKILNIKHNNGLWELGGPDGRWLLKDEVNLAKDSRSVDYSAQKFLRDADIGIPLVEMYRFENGDEKFNFTMMSRAKGKSLYELHGTICDEQYLDLRFDLIQHIKNIRQFTSPHMQRVDGGKLHDNYIGNCYGYPCVETGRNEEEWLENLTPALRRTVLHELWKKNKAGLKDPKKRDEWVKTADARVAELKANFPKGGPYVLTHGDLNPTNTYGSDDNAEHKWKITAIIDWETAGYFPWWVELARSPSLLGGPKDVVHRSVEERLLEFCPPEFNPEDYKPMMDAIKTLAEIWFTQGHVGNSIHGTGAHANDWYSEEFCECHKVRKHFIEYDMGWPLEHHDTFDPDLTDPDDEEPIDLYKYDFFPDERKFLRWFKSISP